MSTATAAHHYATINPYTGETVREFDTLSREEVDRAVAAAHDAYGRWRRRRSLSVPRSCTGPAS